MPYQCLSAQDSLMFLRSACWSSTGFSVRRPIMCVMTARQWLMSTLFFCALSMPAMAALADAIICGRVKQVVVFVLIAFEVRIFRTSMPCMLAGTLIMTFGLI